MISTVRVQEKGQVTIPKDIRKKLRLKKGDLVTFLVQENDVVLKPVSLVAQELFAKLEKSLAGRGIALEAVLGASLRSGGDGAARQYGLSADEKATLFIALQYQAQQALETMRAQAETGGLNQLSDEEINAEIQAVRDEASRSHRA
jgi:AbrB family looped-hinge helix DNA binding protein